MKLVSLLTSGLLLASSALAQDTVKLTRIYENLETKFPIAVVIPPDDSQRQFLALQRGQILILPEDEKAAEAKTFLDLSSRNMEADNGKFEEGLNGLAFHPKFKENGLFYLCYTLQKPKRLVVTEMKVSADGNKADESTERTLLEIPLINWNHHGGNILFGPDGYLYIGVGDTSKRNDEQRMAQLNAVLVGKVLRIDVDSREYNNAYGIPSDNPFADGVNAQPQVYAYGIRNPWGLHFDGQGRFWLADVGQDLWEEINWIVKGGNYGWSYREGSRTFPLRPDPAPSEINLIDPIHEYHHGDGLSITGGVTYIGNALPELKGAYVYGDFVLGKIWALRVDNDGKVQSNDLLYTSPQTAANDPKKKPSVHMKPTAFCYDAKGEMLVLDWNGAIHRLSK
ncbi:PQQ-dependent sugar dehydrogenase [Prosthecobacter sp. SYSU 5D2]|uniref:PQQ-dependent sugar dehydrogenase n=1 Tax=Prosthecobacter sp. SYSU 5D2 TaxID=3134134 RepID=UPI0031FE65BC